MTMIANQDLAFFAGTAVAVVCVLPFVHKPFRRLVQTIMARLQLLLLSPEQHEHATSATVSELFLYPVKSLRRVSVEKATLDKCGFRGDRRFMLVVPVPTRALSLPNDPTHKFLTQRQCPILATIHTEWNGDRLTVRCGEESVTVHTGKTSTTPSLYYNARIWSDVVRVQDVGDEVAIFLQKIITTQEGEGLRLVTMVGDRPCPDSYVPPEARTWTGTTPLTALNDGFPVLIACEASLMEVNRRLKAKGKEEIPMTRFRPNIVIKGTEPFEEDTWKVIQIGDSMFHIVKGCPRCKQSCTDQDTGLVSDEPVVTLGEFRALGKAPEEVYFAQNAIGYGKSVSVGASVKILKRGIPVWEIEELQSE